MKNITIILIVTMSIFLSFTMRVEAADYDNEIDSRLKQLEPIVDDEVRKIQNSSGTSQSEIEYEINKAAERLTPYIEDMADDLADEILNDVGIDN